MIVVLDSLDIFMPYVETLVPGLKRWATKLYFSIYEDNTLMGVEMEFRDTNQFRKYEDELREQGFSIIDNTDDTVVVVIPKDLLLYDTMTLFKDGEFSKLVEHKPLLNAYMKGKKKSELKTDKFIRVIRKDPELRQEISNYLGVILPEDVELGCIPETFNLTNEQIEED